MAETDVVFTSGEAKRSRTGSEKQREIWENILTLLSEPLGSASGAAPGLHCGKDITLYPFHKARRIVFAIT